MDMDLGTDFGRQLLRVVVQMVMVNHAPLASQALQLLIRHFSQRKEMVDGFKQVKGEGGGKGESEGDREKGGEGEREEERGGKEGGSLGGGGVGVGREELATSL